MIRLKDCTGEVFYVNPKMVVAIEADDSFGGKSCLLTREREYNMSEDVETLYKLLYKKK